MSRYPTEQFCEPPKESFICSICQDVFDEPTETPCRHVFCKKCIASVIDIDPKCPLCRAKLSHGVMKPVLPVFKTMLSQLEMHCRYAACTDIITLECYLAHIEACEYQDVTCPIKDCTSVCPKKDLNNHKQNCIYRQVKCPKGCGKKLLVKDTEDHVDFECANGDKKCRTCGKSRYQGVKGHSCLNHLLSITGEIKQENQHLQEELQSLRQKFNSQTVTVQQLQQEIQSLRIQNMEQNQQLINSIGHTVTQVPLTYQGFLGGLNMGPLPHQGLLGAPLIAQGMGRYIYVKLDL